MTFRLWLMREDDGVESVLGANDLWGDMRVDMSVDRDV